MLSPCSRADVVAVQVVHQAVLVVAQRLVPPVHVHAPAGLVEHAAVAVSSLDHGASGGRHLPRAQPWGRKRQRGGRLAGAPVDQI